MRQVTVKSSDVMSSLRAGEWVWGGLGIGAASLSACFAAYMLAFGPSEPAANGVGFGLFATMRPNERVAETRVLPVLRAASRSIDPSSGGDAPAATATASAAIDFAPTGSLDGKPDTAEPRNATAGSSILMGTEKLLPSYILRDVFDGQALVETPSALTLVAKGSVIAGAGEVLSIERRGKQWAVVTSGGIIGGSR